jgi:hypothetical protein
MCSNELRKVRIKMPNHITNRLTITGDASRVLEVKEFVKVEKDEENQEAYGTGTIDFNKIVRMPKDLSIQIHSGIEMAAKNALKEGFDDNPLLASLERHNRNNCKSPLTFNDEEWELFIKTLNNKRKYGSYYWYDWCIENWRTKWNAYSQPDSRNTDNVIFFQTAWSCPKDLINKLTCIFPDVEFEIAWADEDLGHNIGIMKIKNGSVIEQYIPEGGSIEAKKLFFEITQDTLEEHNMNENYEYIDK